ncbi:MAG TPA: ABC transporter permease, partial [Stellaceae bacterium]|nr:ABC transporter permease [Stellaceae bacterium]
MSQRFDALWLVLVFLLLWQALHWLAGSGLSSPIETLARLETMLASGDFWQHALATGRAFFWSVVLTILLGLASGLALGLWRSAGEVMEPILGALYAIPK